MLIVSLQRRYNICGLRCIAISLCWSSNSYNYNPVEKILHFAESRKLCNGLHYTMYWNFAVQENNNTLWERIIKKKISEFRKSVVRRRFTFLGMSCERGYFLRARDAVSRLTISLVKNNRTEGESHLALLP